MELKYRVRLARYEATRNINENIRAVGQIFKETKEQSTFTCKTLRRNLPIEIRQYINLRRSLLKCKKKSTTDLARRAVTRQYQWHTPKNVNRYKKDYQ